MENNVKDNELVEQKPVKEKKEIKALLIYFAVLFFSEFLVIAGFSIKYGSNGLDKIKELSGAYTAIYLMVYSIILLLLFLLLYHKKVFDDIKRTTKKDFLKFILYGVVFYFINTVLSIVFVSIIGAATSNQDSLDSAMKSLAFVTFIPTSFIVPFVEEMVFRFAIGTFFKNKALFVIVSSLLFAVMHGFGLITILYFLLGVMLAFVYLKSDKNIVASTTVHIINNTIASVLSMIL